MTALKPSSVKHPCPVCNRTKDGDCRLGDDLVFCHTHPEGEVGEQRGEYLFVKTNKGDHGTGIWKHQSKWDHFQKTESFYSSRKEWPYLNKSGQHVFSFVRDGHKKFSSTPLEGSPSAYTADLVLYRRDEALKRIEDQRKQAQQPFLFWVEGEKCADVLWSLGLPAVTTQGGANGFRVDRDAGQIPEDVTLILTPDRDRVGVAYIREVAAAYPNNPKQWLRCWPEQNELWNVKCPATKGMDIADWLEGKEPSDARRLLRSAVSEKPIELAKERPEMEPDAEDLEAFKKWIPELLQEEEWKREPLATKRAKALNLSLNTRQIQQLLIQAEHASRGISTRALGRRTLKSERMKVLWEGIIPSGRSCVFVGLPKTYKTQLILNAVGAWWRGEPQYLGRKLNGDCPPVIIVGTDQPQKDWEESLLRAGLPLEVDPDMGVSPVVEFWSAEQGLSLNQEGIERIREVVQNYEGALVICDSIRKLVVAPLGIEEKDARLIGPLQKLELELSPYKASVVYIHHSGKGRAGESPITCGAGGTALPGHATNLVGLQKVTEDETESRVQVWIDGRLGRENKFFFEAQENGDFKLLGDLSHIQKVKQMQAAEDKLTEAQEIVLNAVREIYVTEGLPTTSEQLCFHLGEEWMRNGEPYLQKINPKLRSLANKYLIEETRSCQSKGQVNNSKLWKPVQLPSDTTYKGLSRF